MQSTIEMVAERPVSHNKDDYRGFLRGISLFSEFSDNSINAVIEKAIVRDYKKDKLLFLTGDSANFFYVIIRGWIKLYRETRDGHESVIAIMTDGEMFGQGAILKNGYYNCSAQVMLDTLLFMIPADFMLHMSERNADFKGFIAGFLKDRLHELSQKNLEAEHLAKMTSAQRVGCFLLKMWGKREEDSFTFYLPYEKSLVAGRLGMTPETFSRSLNQLSAIGVEVNNSKVTIHNVNQLKANICDHCSATRRECIVADDD